MQYPQPGEVKAGPNFKPNKFEHHEETLIIKKDTEIQHAIVHGAIKVVGPATVVLDDVIVRGDPDHKALVTLDHPDACLTIHDNELVPNVYGPSYAVDVRHGDLLLSESVLAGVRIGVVIRNDSRAAMWRNHFQDFAEQDSEGVFVQGTSETVVRANRFDLPTGDGCNGSVFVQPNADINELDIEENFLSGGKFPIHIENRTPRRGIYGHVHLVNVSGNTIVKPLDQGHRGTHLMDGFRGSRHDDWNFISIGNHSIDSLDGELVEDSEAPINIDRRGGHILDLSGHGYKNNHILTDYDGPIEDLIPYLRGAFKEPLTTRGKRAGLHFLDGFRFPSKSSLPTIRDLAVGLER